MCLTDNRSFRRRQLSATRCRDTDRRWCARVRLGLNAGAFDLLTPTERDIERRREALSLPVEVAVNRHRQRVHHRVPRR